MGEGGLSEAEAVLLWTLRRRRAACDGGRCRGLRLQIDDRIAMDALAPAGAGRLSANATC